MNDPIKRDAPPKSQVVFEYDPETGNVRWNVATGFPRDKLVNALECCKQITIMQQIGMLQVQQQPGLILPDGQPLPKLR